jgi:hypothetical protein
MLDIIMINRENIGGVDAKSAPGTLLSDDNHG